MNMPVVTIIIANHNYEKYICDAIDSAINQIYPKNRLRIVVIDDCSTDNSWQIVYKKYFQSHTHESNGIGIPTKTVVLPNGVTLIATKMDKSVGPSEARNIAITMTRQSTDIYAILDADDVYYPNKVLKCVQKVMEAPDVIGVVYGDYDIYNVETGNTVREYKEPFDKIRLFDECIVHSGAIITKVALEHVFEPTGFYDKNLRCAEDYDLWLRISDKFMIVHIPESLSMVRVHNNNSTNSVQKEIWQQCWTRVREKLIKRHNEPTSI